MRFRPPCTSLMRFLASLFAVAILVQASLGDARVAPPVSDLTELSLEDLIALEVTSTARRPTRLSDAAAAAFVITGEDIRRSGARTLPDVLRMAPGVQVAQIDANNWAVTVRGFDGRSVYSHLDSGVFWEIQDIMLEDLDRIEVIRGPGAAFSRAVRTSSRFEAGGRLALATIPPFTPENPAPLPLLFSVVGNNDFRSEEILAWKPRPDLGLAVVGRNLFRRSHLEFGQEFASSIPTAVERSVCGMLTWRP